MIKPRVFVSSTIADFRDLRTAVKFYLEELGYEVLLSELNDFVKPLDVPAIEACLEAIERCDYYILLVGEEVGSLWDEEGGISITRAEYRKAKSLTETSGLQMLLFARQSVWDAHRSWKTAASNTHGTPERPDPREGALPEVTVPGVTRPDLVFAFLDEITEADSTKPATNWIHRFSTFRDVVDALRTHLGFTESLQEVALRSNLRREILTNLAFLLQKGANGIFPTYSYGVPAFREFSGGLDSTTRLRARDVRCAVQYAIFGARDASQLRTRVLDRALEAGFGLQFVPETSSLEDTQLSKRLHQLRESISRLKRIRADFEQQIQRFAATYLEPSKRESELAIPNSELLYVATPAGEEENCVSLLTSIYLALEGEEEAVEDVALNPPTPLKDEQSQLSWEEVSLDEASAWARLAAAPKE